MEQITFWIVFLILLFFVVFLEMKYNLLRDDSTLETKKPYSFSRVQLAWWTVILLSSFITIIITKGQAPTLDKSSLILLGISAITLGAARITDISDQKTAAAAPPPAVGDKPIVSISQNTPGQNFFLDILSDNNGVSIHRFQTVVFNFVFGCWFIYSVVKGLNGVVCNNSDEQTYIDCISKIIPVISENNLILIGLSSGTYIVLKTTENKNINK